MAPIRRMQSEARQRIFAQTRGEKGVPNEADLSPPRAARAVDKGLRGGPCAGTQIKHAAEPRGVGKAEIARRLFGFVAEQPSRRDESDHVEASAGQHFATVFHPLPRLLVIKVVKFPLARRVMFGEEFLAQPRVGARFAAVIKSVQDDFMSGRLLPPQPREEGRIFVDVRFVMVVGHDQQGDDRDPPGREIVQHAIDRVAGQRTHVVDGDRQ